MSTAKARYTGDGAWTLTKDFSDTLKTTLRGYFPNQQAETEPTFGHPADAFVSHVLAEARWAVSGPHWQKFNSTKQEIRAEQSDLLKGLHALHHKLRNLSPDFDRLLDIDADPLGFADKVKELIGHVESAGGNIEGLPTKKKTAQQQHEVAVEMAVRVLRALKGYGIAPAATGDPNFGYTSDAVQILKLIGDDIGLVLADVTWRDKIIAVKKIAPGLR